MRRAWQGWRTWRARPPASRAAGGGRPLSHVRAGRHAAGRAGARGGGALAQRRPVQAGEGAGRAGPLRGAQLARLVSPYHAGAASADGADRGRPQKGGPACPAHIPITVPEIRRLLARLLWTPVRAPDEITARSRR